MMSDPATATCTPKVFRYFDVLDPYNMGWRLWSRIYEYEWAIDQLAELAAERAPAPITIHNTACGGDRAHNGWKVNNNFARTLNARFGRVTHSDLTPSTVIKPFIDYDITRPWDGGIQYQAVLCISTLHHLDEHLHHAVLANLEAQLVPGGLLLVTVELRPEHRRALDSLESYYGCEVTDVPNRLNSKNGPVKDDRWGCEVVRLCAEKPFAPSHESE